METQTEDFQPVKKSLCRDKINSIGVNLNSSNRNSQLLNIIKSLSCRNTRDNFKPTKNTSKVSQKTVKFNSILLESNKKPKRNSTVTLLTELLKPSQLFGIQSFGKFANKSIKLKPLCKKTAKRPKRTLRIMKDLD